ncbi:Ig-like domain repeat protein [Conexibacter woesei]|uniref:Ig-like domain repeat protein n=1 Tax=Conexibacter woesei TaxID=191495 RepID=UPI000417EDDE|nr:Ig-like domain repeat protein [Conexibacter woesei]
MHITSRWTRAGGALAAAAATLALASVPAAQAAPERVADTTGYTTTTYLQHALGLPAGDTTPAIEPVTYDRFQWLLQQPGKFAFLIGDPASTTDTTFAQRAQDVEAEAKSEGIRKVYWFNPNLSGNAVVGTITEPTLDIRDASSIGLASASQTKYDNAWKTLIADYLGNGLSATHTGVNSESAIVRIDPSPSTKNDNGGTKFGGNGTDTPLFDYTSSTPANILHSYFLVYDKDHTVSGRTAKILGWTDLSADTQQATTEAVDDAVDVVGSGSDFTQLDQFAWWKDEVNAKHAEQASVVQGRNHPVLTDADAADGWDVEQITYPELVDLLKSGANDKNAAILFGGTWCPNTRPVLPTINKGAQRNGVHVFNFDTVLDGGLVGDATTSSKNPLQTRNTQDNTSTRTANSNPTSLYGDLVNQYLTNINTEYGSIVTYYAGGNTGGTLLNAKKLQVPFLIGYGGNGSTAANPGVKRQWIIRNSDGSYKEYMTNWGAVNPQPNELNIDTTRLPAGAPIWTTINAQLAAYTPQTDPTTLYANTAVYSDSDRYLVAGETATVSYNSASQNPWTISLTGPVDISPTALSTALTALGSSAPANLADAKTALIAALSGSDAPLTANLKTVVGAWQLATNAKNAVNGAWGNATTPGSVAGGLAAVRAADVFFDGLPGAVASRRTVTADASSITVRIDTDYDRNPTGNVALTLKKGGTTVTTASAAVSGGSATFTLPSSLDAGSYDYTLTYATDEQIFGFTETGSLTVPARTTTTTTTTTTPTTTTTTTPSRTPTRPTTTPTAPRARKASAGAVRVVLVSRPTSKKGGRYTVSIAAARGKAAVSGKVTIKLKKGSVTKTITAKLVKGKATFTLPKLAKGTWKVTIAWPGNTTYRSLSKTATSIKVIK